MTEIYQTVYVSLSLVPSDTVARLKDTACRTFDLIPRLELHITLGYLGDVKARDIQLLGTQLEALDGFGTNSVNPTGTGGAVQESDGTLALLTSQQPEAWRNKPRVLWWSIETSEEMIAFRNAFIAIAINLGLDSTYLRPSFSPHVTLGSNGPATPGSDWTLWDVHTLGKPVSLPGLQAPREILIDRLHITNVPLKADSLYIVKKWN